MKIRGIIWGNTLEEAKEELTRLKVVLDATFLMLVVLLIQT